MKKSILFLCLLVALSMIMIIDAQAETSGKCGTNVSWSLDANGTLTISGEGKMSNYTYGAGSPWQSKNVTSVIIKSGVTSIGSYAFKGCTGIKSVTIPGGVTEICSMAFDGCTGLTGITIPNTVTRIGGNAFSGCTGLTSVTIPGSVEKIEDFTFGSCTGLKTVTIKKGVTGIGASAFERCTALTSVAIPDSVKTIDAQAFSECDVLTGVTLPNSVTHIGQFAFSSSGLKSIRIPNSMTVIEYGIFYGCDRLKSITIPGSVTTIKDDAVPYNATVYCGKASYAAKWAAANGRTVSYTDPVIAAQPADVTAAAGTSAVFTVKATGDGLTYQWQYRKSADGSWAKTSATGYNTAALTIPATAARNGWQYRCVVTDTDGNKAVSKAATLTVQAALKITTQPAGVMVTAGTNAKFTVKATGDGLTYQWQYRKSSTGSWTKTSATGYNTAALTIAATAAKNGYQYRCVITDKYGKQVTSKAAALTVQTALKITTQPAGASVTAGTNAKFTVKATGDGLTYQWQYRKSSAGTWAKTSATGYNTASLTIPATASRNGWQYRCVITDKYGNKVTTKAATLTVQAALKITSQPAGVTVTAGAKAKFTVKAAGDGLTYQWQYRKSSTGTWTNNSATGSTTATLTISATAAKNGYQYRCVIRDKYGNKVTTKAATLTVK